VCDDAKRFISGGGSQVDAVAAGAFAFDFRFQTTLIDAMTVFCRHHRRF
jgi:hypothetical protein